MTIRDQAFLEGFFCYILIYLLEDRAGSSFNYIHGGEFFEKMARKNKSGKERVWILSYISCFIKIGWVLIPYGSKLSFKLRNGQSGDPALCASDFTYSLSKIDEVDIKQQSIYLRLLPFFSLVLNRLVIHHLRGGEENQRSHHYLFPPSLSQ